MLIELLRGLDDVRVVDYPGEAVPEHAKVIGVLPEHLQRLYQLYIDLSAKTRQLAEHVKSVFEHDLTPEMLAELEQARNNHEAMRTFFWSEVMAELDSYAHGVDLTIGVATGWQVWVRCDCLACLLGRKIEERITEEVASFKAALNN